MSRTSAVETSIHAVSAWFIETPLPPERPVGWGYRKAGSARNGRKCRQIAESRSTGLPLTRAGWTFLSIWPAAAAPDASGVTGSGGSAADKNVDTWKDCDIFVDPG